MFKALFTTLRLFLFTFACIFTTPALAQVTTDGTVSTQVNQNGNVAEITGGESRGDNLFHSFGDFSVQTGNEAFFNNASDISNILGRVTGGNVSNIDGLIRANGSANLFLINPAGIIFGQNARLDIGGSFYGSSASSILFEDGEFSAADLENPPILTVNAPVGLGFRDDPGDITVRGDGNGIRTIDNEPIDTQSALRVGRNSTIGLIGANLIFENATIKTAGGNIELGSVREGRVDLIEAANDFSFDYSGVETFGNISLSGTSIIDASGNGGGNIQVAGSNITLEDSSQIEASTLGNEAGSEINLFATDEISISGVENENNFLAGIFNQVYTGATADAGDINIETSSLSMDDRATITTSVFGTGNGGNIQIDASDSINIKDSIIFNSIKADARGNAGTTEINTTNLSLINGGLINARALGIGNSGSISIDATESIAIDSVIIDGEGNFVDNPDTGIFNQVSREGNVGDINITTNNLSLTNGGSIDASSSGNGDSGNISIEATESVLVDGATFFDADDINIPGSYDTGISNLIGRGTKDTTGNVGNINIITTDFTLIREGFINAGNYRKGNGGNISIDASGTLAVKVTSFIFSGIISGAEGDARNINFNTSNFEMESGSFVSSSILGTGNGGDILINATESFSIESGSDVFNIVGVDAVGNAGTIQINTKSFDLNGSAGEINASTFGKGNGGDIIINASESFTSSNDGQLESTVGGGAEGNAGDITVNTKVFTVAEDGAGINAGVLSAGKGNGGNITINASELVSITGRRSISNVVGRDTEGNGGTININTANLKLIDGGGIESGNNENGKSSDIFINASESIEILGREGEDILGRENANLFTGITDNVRREGQGGNIEIFTPRLNIAEAGVISNATFGNGNAGNITINASESINILGRVNDFSSGIFNTVTSDAGGNGGNINISTANLNLSNGAQIVAETSANGDAGNVQIDVSDNLSLEGLNSGIFSRTGSTGDAGTIDLNASNLRLSNNAQIAVNNFIETELQINNSSSNGLGITRIFNPVEGSGNTGTLEIASDTIKLENGGSITAISAGGNGGDINIDSNFLSLRSSGNISTTAGLQNTPGSGGDININSQFIVAFPEGNNDITANAFKGGGGNISIATEGIFGIQERLSNPLTNDITASSEAGISGNVAISTPGINPVQSTTQLSTNVLAPQETSQQACKANRELAARNGFNIEGKGGVVADPGLPLNSLNVNVNREIDSTSTVPAPVKTSYGEIQPARGIKVTKSGKIILTAYRTNNAGERIPQSDRNCG